MPCEGLFRALEIGPAPFSGSEVNGGGGSVSLREEGASGHDELEANIGVDSDSEEDEGDSDDTDVGVRKGGLPIGDTAMNAGEEIPDV